MIELLNQDLSWMEALHDSEDVDHPSVIQPGVGQFSGGEKPVEVNIEAPYTLLIAPGMSVVHRGTYGLVESMPPAHILAMALHRFWLTPKFRGLEQTTLDGLVRWCEAAPALTGKRCPRCKGRRFDPSGERHPADENMVMACRQCEGHGVVIGNFDAGLDKIGQVQVDRRLLLPVLKNLRGDEVALGVSESVNGDGFEAHIRPFTRRSDNQTGDWGEWRIQLDDFSSVASMIKAA